MSKLLPTIASLGLGAAAAAGLYAAHRATGVANSPSVVRAQRSDAMREARQYLRSTVPHNADELMDALEADGVWTDSVQELIPFVEWAPLPMITLIHALAAEAAFRHSAYVDAQAHTGVPMLKYVSYTAAIQAASLGAMAAVARARPDGHEDLMDTLDTIEYSLMGTSSRMQSRIDSATYEYQKMRAAVRV